MKKAKDINGNIVDIEDVLEEESYYCIVCGGELKVKLGSKRQYFSHLIGKNDECDAKLNTVLQAIQHNKKDENNYEIDDSDLFDNKYNDLVEDINGFTDEQLLVINSKEKRIKVDSKAGCVDADTEFLTPTGWKKISEYKEGDMVLQYNRDNTAYFVYPKKYYKYKEEYMTQFETKYGINQCLSDEHNVVYLTPNNVFKKEKFIDIKNKHINGLFKGKFITSYNINNCSGIDISNDNIRVMIAVIADGTFNYNSSSNWCRLNLKRKDKQERIKKLLKDSNIEFKEAQWNPKDLEYRNFSFYAPIRTKIFPKEWYSMSKEQLEVVADEVLKWDGEYSKRNNKSSVGRFFTTIKENADFIQFVFSSLNYRANILIQDRVGRIRNLKGYDCNYITKSIDYTVSITKRNLCGITSDNREGYKKTEMNLYKTLDGYKYCFSVDSEMLVLRRKNCIFITGNTGKTSVCEEYIKVNSDKSILYMIFNKTMAEEAKERFGHLSNVEIRTTYSMAYQAIGYQYKHKLTTSYNLFNVANALNIRMYKPEDYKYVSDLESLFTLYLSSWYYDIDSFINSLSYKDITPNHKKDLKKLFNESKKLDNDVKVTHGFYFKLWHLSKPDLSNYDVIVIDEVQDSQPAMIDIIRENKSVDTIMIVGDAQQNIYGFMNTINGLKVLNEGWTEYNLTKSFRIGNTNAHLIKSCMSEVLGRDFNIEGYNKKQIIVKEVDITKPHYKLCRYNSTIIDNAIISALDGKKIYIEGGSAGVDFTYIKLIYDFWKYGKQHYSLKKYNDYSHMINTAKKINDVNTLQAHKLITEHKDNLLFKLKSIEENLVKDWELADICYSTIHKSKGMTITIPVIIADDVIDLNEVSPSTLEKHEQEVNLLYVALSRSKNKIQVPSSVLNMYEGLKYNKESI